MKCQTPVRTQEKERTVSVEKNTYGEMAVVRNREGCLSSLAVFTGRRFGFLSGVDVGSCWVAITCL